MGVAEIIGFAVCWLVVAGLMLWGVFTEKKRGPSRLEPPAGRRRRGTPPEAYGTSPTDWVVVEVAEGCTPEVAEQARFLAAAWLASRGIDMAAVPPADIRTEVTTAGDGTSTTRVLVEGGLLADQPPSALAARRSRQGGSGRGGLRAGPGDCVVEVVGGGTVVDGGSVVGGGGSERPGPGPGSDRGRRAASLPRSRLVPAAPAGWWW